MGSGYPVYKQDTLQYPLRFSTTLSTFLNHIFKMILLSVTHFWKRSYIRTVRWNVNPRKLENKMLNHPVMWHALPVSTDPVGGCVCWRAFKLIIFSVGDGDGISFVYVRSLSIVHALETLDEVDWDEISVYVFQNSLSISRVNYIFFNQSRRLI